MIPAVPSLFARLKFRQLSLLLALDEFGSLHRASEHLNMTQPGLTKALHEIEAIFGAELFIRSKTGVLANELGQCVIRYARIQVFELDHLRDQMMGVLRGSGGRVAVGAITGALHGVLIEAVARLRAQQPLLSIEIRESSSLDLLEWVNEGRLDLAVCRTSVLSDTSHFNYEPLMEEAVAAAVGLKHPLARAKRVSLNQLTKCRWVVYPSNMPLRKFLEQEFRQCGLQLPTYSVQTASSLATMLMLKQDSGLVALMASATMDFCEEHGIARRLPLRFRTENEGFGMVTRRGAHLSPAANLLVMCMRTICRAT